MKKKKCVECLRNVVFCATEFNNTPLTSLAWQGEWWSLHAQFMGQSLHSWKKRKRKKGWNGSLYTCAVCHPVCLVQCWEMCLSPVACQTLNDGEGRMNQVYDVISLSKDMSFLYSWTLCTILRCNMQWYAWVFQDFFQNCS